MSDSEPIPSAAAPRLHHPIIHPPAPSPVSKNPFKHLRASDMRGIAQLITHATANVTRITEGVHQAVLSTMGIPGSKESNRTICLTGLVYKSIYGVTYVVGKSVDGVLGGLQPLFEEAEAGNPGTRQREALLAALNGVMGDHLAATANPLAIPMTMRYRGRVLDWDAPRLLPTDATDFPVAEFPITGKILLMVHGLCMNDLQWDAQHVGLPINHGETTAALYGYTPIYLRYNSGLHTAQNGRELAAQLEQLINHWPMPVEELTVLAHSMGGLITRGAFYYGRRDNLRWPQLLRNIVFLGTPHHGAPLEQAGNWLDTLLGVTPFSAPFGKIAQLRSAGITDLRWGHVLEEDKVGNDRFYRQPDARQIMSLPTGVACYTVAATTSPRRGLLADRLVGDGLVPLHSALGQHDDVRRSLAFPRAAQAINFNMTHIELLSSPAVTHQILDWLAPDSNTN